MKKLLINLNLLLLAFLLIACSNNSEESNAAILYLNGEELIGQKIVDSDEYTLLDKIGEVQVKTDAGVKPTQELTSNALEVGTEIYTVKEDEQIYVAKLSNHQYQVFSKNANK